MTQRILVVEDEPIVALSLEMLLESFGFEVVGPVGRINEAQSLAESAELDACLLDVNLHGESVLPVADTLAGRKIPFLFLTGYDKYAVPSAYGRECVLAKPYKPEALLEAIEAMMVH